MRCKKCGEFVRKSGEIYIADLSLGDKATLMRAMEWNIDYYRRAAMYCNFDLNESTPHEVSEVDQVVKIMRRYEGR